MKKVSTALNCSRSRFFQVAAAVALSLLAASSGVSQPAPHAGSKGPFVVLLGAPASGKTTQGHYLGKKYDVPVVHATDVLEKAIRRAATYAGPPNRKQGSLQRSEKARKALNLLQAGELVDDESLNGFVASRVSQDDCRNGFVIDGFPNTVDQAVFFMSTSRNTGSKV